MAAAIRAPARAHTEREPLAAKAPAANSSESPGRKGVTTSPVSQKTIAKSSRYVQAPYSWMIGLRCLSRCRTKSSSPLRIPMAPRRLRAPRPKVQRGRRQVWPPRQVVPHHPGPLLPAPPSAGRRGRKQPKGSGVRNGLPVEDVSDAPEVLLVRGEDVSARLPRLGRQDDVHIQAVFRAPQLPARPGLGPDVGRQPHGLRREGDVSHRDPPVQAGESLPSPLPRLRPIVSEVKEFAAKLVINNLGYINPELEILLETRDRIDNRLIVDHLRPQDLRQDVVVQQKKLSHLSSANPSAPSRGPPQTPARSPGLPPWQEQPFEPATKPQTPCGAPSPQEAPDHSSAAPAPRR